MVKWYMSSAGHGGAASPRADVAENTTLRVWGFKGAWRFRLARTTDSGWATETLYWDRDQTYDTCAIAKKAAARWFGNWVLSMAFNTKPEGSDRLTQEKVEGIQAIWGTEDDFTVRA